MLEVFKIFAVTSIWIAIISAFTVLVLNKEYVPAMFVFVLIFFAKYSDKPK